MSKIFNILTFKFIDIWSKYSAKKLFEPMKNNPDSINQLKLLIEKIKRVEYEENELNEDSYIGIFNFTFKGLYGAIIKGGLLLSIAWLLNILEPTLVVTASFGIIRVFAGGFHFESYALCTYVSIASLLVLGVIGKHLDYNMYINIIVAVFSVILFILFAPVENKNLPIKPKNKPIFKLIAILNTTTITILNLLVFNQATIILGILMTGIITIPILNKKGDKSHNIST